MDSSKTGALIRKLRRERGLTQRQLAEKVLVSDKAVSKWERGMGCPDVSIVARLGAALGVSADALLAGEAPVPEWKGPSMRKAQWYVCPTCGNVVMSTGPGPCSLTCCGAAVAPLEPRKAAPEQRLRVEEIDGAWSVSGDSPMTKDDFVSFVALVTGDRAQVVRTYPEWDLRVRFPRSRGILLWYSTREGLLYQVV